MNAQKQPHFFRKQSRILWKISALIAVIIYPGITYGIVPQLPPLYQEYGGQVAALLALAFFLLAAILLYEGEAKDEKDTQANE